MLNLLELALNNDLIYIGIIIFLIIIIILTILSIKKDRDRAINNRPILEPAKNEEEKESDRLELEKVVNDMKKNIESKENNIKSYEQNQEEAAIISYQELVKAVRNENENVSTPHNEVGMEVADKNFIEEPTVEEEKTKVPVFDEPQKEETIEIENLKVDTEKKFQSSEFISPIFGTAPQGNIKEVEKKDDSEITMDDIIDEDFDEDDEFLDSLKGFRKNL